MASEHQNQIKENEKKKQLSKADATCRFEFCARFKRMKTKNHSSRRRKEKKIRSKQRKMFFLNIKKCIYDAPRKP